MPEEDSGAGEMQQAQEVVDMTFPARDETTRVVEPREEPFDLPASARATERTAILRGPSTPPVCRDHLDAVLGHHTFVEGIAVVAAGRRSGASGGPRGSGRRGWRGRGAAHTVKRWPRGRRQEDMAGAERPDLASPTASRKAHRSAPFFLPRERGGERGFGQIDLAPVSPSS